MGEQTRHFRITMHMDGAKEVGVDIKPIATSYGTDYLVTVRPKGRRVVYSGLLSKAVEGIAVRHAREIAERRDR